LSAELGILCNFILESLRYVDITVALHLALSLEVNVGIGALPVALPYFHRPTVQLVSITPSSAGRSATVWILFNS
jgi:hypothetical protein